MLIKDAVNYRDFIASVNNHSSLTLNLLTWTKWWAPASASKWQMGFNSAFKRLME